mmetsp:Transcript_10915/g.14215  ORF Transcript_10915/g.14215 Transcript_10915/m.14215 type:complete len:262 (+) Transcript_10915:148-933(+)
MSELTDEQETEEWPSLHLAAMKGDDDQVLRLLEEDLKSAEEQFEGLTAYDVAKSAKKFREQYQQVLATKVQQEKTRTEREAKKGETKKVAMRRSKLRKKAQSKLERGDFEYHAFLSHSWGKSPDYETHGTLIEMNEKLVKDFGLVTWFDADRLNGDIEEQIEEGIVGSDKVVVFLTEFYHSRIQLSDSDTDIYCKFELRMAKQLKKSRIIFVVLDEYMTHQKRNWKAAMLSGHFSSRFFIDMSTPELRDSNMHELVKQILE